MLVTKASIEALFTGFSTIYRSAYNDTPEYSGRFTTTVPSSSALETYGWMTRILKMRKWDGPRLIQNLNTEAYVLHNDTYENTIGVPVNHIEDDTLGVYNPQFNELGRTTRKWKDQLVKTVLQSGTSATSFDGVAFFSASHPIDPAGNQSNTFTSSALNATNFDTVRAAMTSYTGEDGEPLGVMPRLLVVPPQLEKEALEIVAAERNSSGATNVLRGSAEVLVVPELANEPTVWYLMDVSGGIKPLIFQDRQSPTMTQKNSPNDDNVFLDDMFLTGVKARGAVGFGLWWLCARCIA